MKIEATVQSWHNHNDGCGTWGVVEAEVLAVVADPPWDCAGVEEELEPEPLPFD